MSKPSFTIVTTVRNDAATIRAFVEPLLVQPRKPDEILIVAIFMDSDGAQTSASAIKIVRFAKK